MKIADLELFLLRVAVDEASPCGRSLLLCLSTDSGLCGWGEAPLPWRADELPGRRDLLLTALAGRAVFDIEEALTLEVLDDPALACAVEMACWDLIGQIAAQPVCHLWGGSYRSRVPLVVRIPQTPAPGFERLARELFEQGFHRQIVTATGNVEADAAAVAIIRDSLGRWGDLHVDGRGLFTLSDARELCGSLVEQGIGFLLDPLAERPLAAAASLAQQTNQPIALCRPIANSRDAMAAVRSGAAAALVVDPHRVGGLTAARKCSAVAEAAGVPVALACQASLGVAAAAMVQLAAATPSLAGGSQCEYHQLRDDVLAEPLEIVDGMTVLSKTPGLGAKIDRGKIEKHQEV